MIKAIYLEYQSENFGKTSVLQAFLHILLIRIQRLCLSCSFSNDSSTVGQFKRLVSENFSNMKTIQDYACLLGISTGYLNDIVKSVTGNTPGQIIRREIILEAKRLLAFTDMTVAETGYNLGFEDPSYFGRFFTRETGTSPKTFRKNSSLLYI